MNNIFYPKTEIQLWNTVEDFNKQHIVYPRIKPTIQLKSVGNGHYHIERPSGEYVTASKLKVGKAYLYCGLYKWREIVEIVDDGVYYTDDLGHAGYCSKTHFAQRCPHEATDAELYFLDEYQNYNLINQKHD